MSFMQAISPVLLLLVHLRILQFPHIENSEYDLHLFDSTQRGMRQRTKAMEDISFFLVELLEGGRDKARMMLLTYPCTTPSETLAFRTLLTKYLESLRHRSIFSGFGTRSAAKLSASTAISPARAEHAWWWKDVLVRKSYLEECSGSKFERLMLAFSTHILMKKTKHLNFDDMKELLSTQSFVYWKRLANYRLLRNEWITRATGLLRRQARLTYLGALLAARSYTQNSYDNIPSSTLSQLAESKVIALQRISWRGSEGRTHLLRFLRAAGVRGCTSVYPVRKDPGTSTFLITTIPPPLVDASAIHQSQLHELSLPILASIHLPPSGTSPDDKNDLPFLDDTQHSERVALRERSVLLADAMQRLQTCSGSEKRRLDAFPGSPIEKNTITLWCKARSRLNLSIPPFDDSPALHYHVLRGEVSTLRQSILPLFPLLRDLDSHRIDPPSVTQAWQTSNRFFPSPLDIAAKNPTPDPSPQPGASKVFFDEERHGLIPGGSLRQTNSDGESDISQIISRTEEDSTDEGEKGQIFMTPKKRGVVNRIWTAGSGRPSTTKKSTRRPSFPMSTDPIAGVPDLHLSFFGSRPSLFLKGLDADVDDRWSGDEDDGDDDQCLSPLLVATRPPGRVLQPNVIQSLQNDLPGAFYGESVPRPQTVYPTQAPMQPHGDGSRLNAQSQRAIFIEGNDPFLACSSMHQDLPLVLELELPPILATTSAAL